MSCRSLSAIATIVTFALTTVTTLAAATPRQIDVRLVAAPEFSQEGIHIRTAQGAHSMYAIRAKAAVFKAFELAKAGQCLRLQVSADFDFSDASKIQSVHTGCP